MVRGCKIPSKIDERHAVKSEEVKIGTPRTRIADFYGSQSFHPSPAVGVKEWRQAVCPPDVRERRLAAGGEGEIRTLEPIPGLHDFQSCALDQLRDFSMRLFRSKRINGDYYIISREICQYKKLKNSAGERFFRHDRRGHPLNLLRIRPFSFRVGTAGENFLPFCVGTVEKEFSSWRAT